MLSAAEVAWQRLRGVYERSVSRFISPSRFMSEQMAMAGWKIPCDVIPNALPLGSPRSGPGSGFLLICRLAVGKGVHLALEAAAEAGVDITVAGTGPLEAELKASFPGSRFLGHVPSEQIEDLIRLARAVIVPSEWFENAPMSVLEPMSFGIPVIGSDIGGIPEQITDGHDGLLVAPGNVAALAAAMRRLEESDELVESLGRGAHRTIRERFTPEGHVTKLVATYEAALSR